MSTRRQQSARPGSGVLLLSPADLDLLRTLATNLAESGPPDPEGGRYLLTVLPQPAGETAGADFGQALRRLRQARGLSLRGLARRTHFDFGYLGQVERGERSGSAALARICDEVLNADGALRAAFEGLRATLPAPG